MQCKPIRHMDQWEEGEQSKTLSAFPSHHHKSVPGHTKCYTDRLISPARDARKGFNARER